MAGRRSRGTGSVSQRPNGLWEARLDLGWRGGKRVRKSFYAHTKGEVERLLRDALHDLDRGKRPQPVGSTVAVYLAAWLPRAQPRLRPSTFRRYEQVTRLQIIPNLGHLRLTRLEPGDVADMLAQLRQAGMSPRAQALALAVLKTALGDGEREGVLGRNVARLVRAPRPVTPHPVVLSPDEVRKVLDACTDPSLRRAAELAITSGLRLGEQLGLRWADIDFERRYLRVETTLQRQAGGYVLSESPKTASSRRVVTVPDVGVEALRAERQSQQAARGAAGSRWHEAIPDLCFTTPLGAPRSGTTVLHQFQRALASAGLPRLVWHDFRAAHGSLLLADGVDISVVSRRLGHSSVAVTSRHYGGVSESLMRGVADRLGRMLAD